MDVCWLFYCWGGGADKTEGCLWHYHINITASTLKQTNNSWNQELKGKGKGCLKVSDFNFCFCMCVSKRGLLQLIQQVIISRLLKSDSTIAAFYHVNSVLGFFSSRVCNSIIICYTYEKYGRLLMHLFKHLKFLLFKNFYQYKTPLIKINTFEQCLYSCSRKTQLVKNHKRHIKNV